jgi:hypothetical protein
MRGRPEAARDILSGARATLEELGLSLELNETHAHSAMVELLADEPGRAVDHLREALAGFLSLGADAAAGHASALLARALVARGEPDDCEAALEAVAFADEHGGEDLRTSIIALSARAEALAQAGQIDAAVESARRAVELANPTDALADKADASMALARVLQAAGRYDDAGAAARAAATAYAAKGHTVGAEAAARLPGRADAPSVAPPVAGVQPGVLGDRPSERLMAEFIRHCNAHEFDDVKRLLVDDCYILDHRALGWEPVYGREQCMPFIRSPFEVSPHVRHDIDQVLAADDRVVVTLNTWRGHGIKAGDLEVRRAGRGDGRAGAGRTALGACRRRVRPLLQRTRFRGDGKRHQRRLLLDRPSADGLGRGARTRAVHDIRSLGSALAAPALPGGRGDRR